MARRTKVRTGPSVVKKMIEKEEYDRINNDPESNFYGRTGTISINNKTLYYILVRVK